MGLNISTLSAVANKDLKCPGTDFVELDKKRYGSLKKEINDSNKALKRMDYSDMDKRREMTLTNLKLLVEFVQKLNSDKEYLRAFVDYVNSVQGLKGCKKQYDEYISELAGMYVMTDISAMSKEARKYMPKDHPNTILNVEVHKLAGYLIKELGIPASVIKTEKDKLDRFMKR